MNIRFKPVVTYPTDPSGYNQGAALLRTSDGQAVVSTGAGYAPVNEFEVTYRQQPNSEMADEAFYIAHLPVRVVSVKEIHSTAGSDGSAVNLQLTKDVSTNAPGAGTNLLTNNTNAGFNLKGTANTVQTGTLTATVASLKLAIGDRLAVDYAGTLTACAGVVVTVTLRYI